MDTHVLKFKLKKKADLDYEADKLFLQKQNNFPTFQFSHNTKKLRVLRNS